MDAHHLMDGRHATGSPAKRDAEMDHPGRTVGLKVTDRSDQADQSVPPSKNSPPALIT